MAEPADAAFSAQDEAGQTGAGQGRIVHCGRRIATSEATLKDSAGKLLAHGTETCMIFPLTSDV